MTLSRRSTHELSHFALYAGMALDLDVVRATRNILHDEFQ